MGNIIHLDGFRNLKEPAVIPGDTALERISPDAIKLLAARLKFSAFPFRNRRLTDAGDLRQFGLSQVENGFADMQHRRHDPTLFENEFIRQPILFDNSSQLPLPFPGRRSMAVGKILAEIMRITELRQAPLAKKLHVGQSTISKWISGEHSPNKDQWDRVLKFIAKDKRLGHLMQPAGGADAPEMDDDFRNDWQYLSSHHRDLLKQLAKQLRRDQEPEKPTG